MLLFIGNTATRICTVLASVTRLWKALVALHKFWLGLDYFPHLSRCFPRMPTVSRYSLSLNANLKRLEYPVYAI